MKIAIQGQEGSYHAIAARKLCQHIDMTLLFFDKFEDVYESLLTKECDYAVVALANSVYGFVPESFNLLVKHGQNLSIIDELYLKVEHQLLGLSDAKLADIKYVHSQAPAIGQCTEFLQSKLPQVIIVEENDTAQSAQKVRDLKDKSHAAIASRLAASLNNLHIKAADIQNSDNNLTRFIMLSAEENTYQNDSNQTSIILKTAQTSGSLAKVLNIFADHSINLLNLHSSYIPDSKFEMQFFVEFVGSANSAQTVRCLAEIGKTADFTVLGSYRSNLTSSL